MRHLAVVGKAHESGAGERAFHWFIYGSSLDENAFAAWCKEHGYALPDLKRAVPVRLDGYRLAFDVMSRFWGGAVASIEPADGAGSVAVEGIALPLSADARGLVDHKEGVISGLFEPLEVRVTPLAGGDALPALAFRTAPARRLPKPAPPSVSFVETLVRGARAFGLSDAYVASLTTLLPGATVAPR